jgi:AcrR family transcriptional regulator
MNPHSESATAAPRLRGRFREATKAAILEAAEDVYSRHGLASGRMEQVAATAGVSVGTLYNYFASREALVAEVHAARRRELLDRIEQALAATPERFEPRLRALLSAIFTHLAAHRRFLSLFNQESPATDASVAHGDASTQTQLEIRSRVRAVIELGVTEGKLRNEPPRFFAAVLVGMVRAILASLDDDGEADAETMSARVERAFLDGARRR